MFIKFRSRVEKYIAIATDNINIDEININFFKILIVVIIEIIFCKQLALINL